ncbi:AMP-binding protein [Ochrobactrum sp. CM-21-5]|nr:AMP-binding protein [Ochrobactrum sp. CM-21-5]MBC2885143.1 AMP-binding protein [Ochrobactrum sp. CM-21-5]
MIIDDYIDPQHRCFSDILAQRAKIHPQKNALIIVGTDGGEKTKLTYGELHNQVDRYAAALREKGLSGSRALMLFEPGAGFVISFFACLRAGVTPLPCHLAKPGRSTWERLIAIVQDSDAACILTEAASIPKLAGWFADSPELTALPLLASEDLVGDPSQFQWERPSADTPAFLQYTSGSTGNPKGTIVTFGNLHAHSNIAGPMCGFNSDAVIVCWLPPYHDLGLIGNILQSIYDGALCVLLPPVSLIQNPGRWLETISRYRATISMAPNFAYELCVRRIPSEKREGLDLSSWKCALIGAEPIRASMIESFTKTYREYGFRPETFRPAYGLAEATLIVTISDPASLPQIQTVDSHALDNGHIVPSSRAGARAIVSSGRPRSPQQVTIVDPESRKICNDGIVGEIWISGPCVANGYWRRPDVTRDTFGAMTMTGEGPFLRTGDLGTIIDGELYVTGRIKEVMIIRGRNIYPQDIEATVQEAHEALKPAGGAVFAIDDGKTESIVVVQEIERSWLSRIDTKEIMSRISQAVFREHELAVSDIVLVKPETVPKTSSGKIQRVLCRKLYLDNDLGHIASRRGQETSSAHPATISKQEETAPPGIERDDTASGSLLHAQGNHARSKADSEEMRAWLRDYAARRINTTLMDTRRLMAPHLVLDLGNQGLLGMDCPAALGGRDLALRDTLRVIEQVGAVDLTMANFVTLHNSLGLRPLLIGAKREQQEKIVPAIAAGRELIAFALTEDAAGSNPRAMQSKAERTGNHWKINGQKTWIGNAGWAKHINVFALAYDTSLIGISGFHVTTDQPGVIVGEEHMTMGLRSMVQNSVYFSDAKATDDAVLGDIGKGMTIAQDAMMRTRLYIAAGAVGGIKSALGFMENYSTKRHVAGGLLAHIPETKRKISSALADARALEVIIDYTTALAESRHKLYPQMAAIAKIVGSERLWAVLDDTCQIMGGRGYMEPNIIPQMMRDARILRIFEGPTETLLDYVGSAFQSSMDDITNFIENDFGDRQTSSLLKQVAAEWFSIIATQNAGANVEFGRVIADAIMVAAARIASKRHDVPVEMLEDRLAVTLARIERLRETSNLPDAKRKLDILGTARSCADEVAVPLSQPFGETWTIDRHFVQAPTETEFRNESTAAIELNTRAMASNTEKPLTEEIQRVIADWIHSEDLSFSIEDNRSFADLGIDSLRAVTLTHHLESAFSLELDETILWVYPNMRALVGYIAERSQQRPVGTRRQ